MASFRPAARVLVADGERRRIVNALSAALTDAASVRFAALFGSFARGEPAADIDIAIWFAEGWDFRDPGRLASQLNRVVAHAKLSCDVVAVNAASPLFRYRVATEGQLLYEQSPGLWASFYGRAIVEWSDLALSLSLTGHAVGRFGGPR